MSRSLIIHVDQQDEPHLFEMDGSFEQLGDLHREHEKNPKGFDHAQLNSLLGIRGHVVTDRHIVKTFDHIFVF